MKRLSVIVCVVTLLAAACGSDAGEPSASSTTEPATASSIETSDSTSTGGEPAPTTVPDEPVLDDDATLAGALLAEDGDRSVWRATIGDDVTAAVWFAQTGDLIRGGITYDSVGDPIALMGSRIDGSDSYVIREHLFDGRISGTLSIGSVSDGVVANALWGELPLQLELVSIEEGAYTFDSLVRPGHYEFAYPPFGEDGSECCGPIGHLYLRNITDDSIDVEIDNVASGPGFGQAYFPSTTLTLDDNRATYQANDGDLIDCAFEVVIFDGFAYLNHLDDRFACGFGNAGTVAGTYVLTRSFPVPPSDPVASVSATPPAGTDCDVVNGVWIEYDVNEPDDRISACLRVGVHQDLYIRNSSDGSVSASFPWGFEDFDSGDFIEHGPVTDWLEVGWHEFESDSGVTRGVWVSPPEDSAFNADVPLEFDSYGPLRLGETRASLTERFGVRPHDPAVDDEIAEGCTYVTIPDDPYSPWMMLLGDGDEATIARIEPVAPFQRPATGIGVGSTEDEVFAAYDESVGSDPHVYVSPPAAYLTVSADDGSRDESTLLFETNELRVVTSVRNGQVGPISWVEGCL